MMMLTRLTGKWKPMACRNYSTFEKGQKKRYKIIPFPKDFDAFDAAHPVKVSFFFCLSVNNNTHLKYHAIYIKDESGLEYAFEMDDNWRAWMTEIIQKMKDKSTVKVTTDKTTK
jgi:hypothetical protein